MTEMPTRARLDDLRAQRDATLNRLGESIRRLEQALVENACDVEVIGDTATRHLWFWGRLPSAPDADGSWRFWVKHGNEWVPLTGVPVQSRLEVVAYIRSIVEEIQRVAWGGITVASRAVSEIDRLVADEKERT